MTPQSPARYKAADPVDFLIVGSGAAGAVLAKELSSNGFRVVVLEQGPYIRPNQFDHDEYAAVHRAALTNNYSRQPNTFRKTSSDTAKIQPLVGYGRLVGGGPVHFTGNFWRFHEIDFIERSRKGPIAGTGFADWPLTYADLEPYYTKAEWELGVSGLAGANPFDPPRSKPYPLPPLPIKSSGVLVERGATKLGWHAFPAPLAILSKDYRGRSACMHCGFCEAFGCEFGAKSSTLAAMIPLAEATGRCEIRPDSYVREIEVGDDGRVTGVIYFDREKREQRQRAKAVVVSANGAETPRLLLMSASKRFPNGLANGSGLVGKYLMFGPGSIAGGLFEHPLNEFKGVHVSRVIHDFYEIDPKHGFFGGGGLDGRFDWYPAGFALGGLDPARPQWGGEFKRALKDFPKTMYVLPHQTALALEGNAISLDPAVKDAWGLPALRVTYKDHPDDLKTAQFLLDRAMELLDAAGATRRWAYPVAETESSVHLLGTCRMGKDAATSVVNTDHRAHDVPNLFVCDGSSLVTSGRNQPTETIQALAFRAADRLTALAKRHEI
ncbi:MAG: GMC family oxidoreductase [Acidobacteriota bacterium]